MAFAVDGRTFVLVHSDQEPSDAEWNAYIAEFGQHLQRQVGIAPSASETEAL